MGRARNFAAFETALKRVQIPMFNVVYADAAGHVLYQYNGIVPVHPEGDFAFWNGLVPGDQSATLWHAIHAYADLPRVLDPPTGFVQNANDPPWVSTYPPVIAPEQYPAYMSPTPQMSLRAQQSADLLLSKSKLDYDDFVQLKHSTVSLLAERMLPDLLRAAAASGKPELGDAIELLKSWNHRYDSDSRGALLFENWARKFMGPAFTDTANFAVPWSLADPLETPRGLRDSAVAVSMLEQAAHDTVEKDRALDRPFGEVSRFHIDDVNLPGNGGIGNIGVFRTINWGPMASNGERTPVNGGPGETYVFMVEFSHPMKAMGALSYGNSSQPGSPHHSDQLALLAAKKLRPLWRRRDEIVQHLEARQQF
jgi:acyl-homoserine-lactone acylase